MMRVVPLVLCLSACAASPSPGFMGTGGREVSRNGRDYVVFQKDEKVEVIRKGRARNGEHQAIRADMIALVPEVTGCRLRESSVQGDSGVMRALVTC